MRFNLSLQPKPLLSIFALCLLGLTLSCSQANSGTPEAQEQDLYTQIEQLVQTQGCNTSSDCDLLPIGNKPCGGPESYMVYSKTNNDVETLKQLAQDYEKERRQYNKDNQVMGICVVTPKPNVSCVRNQCVASKQGTHIQ